MNCHLKSIYRNVTLFFRPLREVILGRRERTTVRHGRGMEAWLAEFATRQGVAESGLLSITRTALWLEAERSSIYGNSEVFCASC
jgi:hypothetical protein